MFNITNGSKPYHIFLTGPKQIGKSTLIKEVINNTDLKYQAVFSTTVSDKESRKHYLEGKLIGECIPGQKIITHPEVFDDSLDLLDIKPGTELFVIDEVGFIEEKAPEYCKKLLSLLDQSNVHVLGVLRQNPNSFLYNAIKNHDNVKTFVIGEANRSNMAPVVNRLLHHIQRS